MRRFKPQGQTRSGFFSPQSQLKSQPTVIINSQVSLWLILASAFELSQMVPRRAKMRCLHKALSKLRLISKITAIIRYLCFQGACYTTVDNCRNSPKLGANHSISACLYAFVDSISWPDIPFLFFPFLSLVSLFCFSFLNQLRC